MSFGDVLINVASPSTNPMGIGGTSSTVWHCDSGADKLYELTTNDFSVIRSSGSKSSIPDGIGGDDNVIWHCDQNNDVTYKLSTTDFSIINSAPSLSDRPYGIGGDVNAIWYCEGRNHRLYELNVSDLSSVRYASSWGDPNGMGGDDNTIYHSDYNNHRNYKLSIIDFSVIRYASSPNLYPAGIGGADDTIYHCNYVSHRIYKLDAANVFTLSGTIADEWGNQIRGVDITIGTTYTTTTDENGAYSQVVSPDTYDITVSKPRSTFRDTTESKLVTSDTTLDIIMPTDKIISKHTTEGMSIIGGISLGTKRN